MQPSSPSTAHSTPVPIKVQHKIAKKKKVTRRRRIDLDCGCTVYIGIHCANNGFTHRGTHHCSSGTEWRVYLDGSKSPIFQDNRSPQQAIQQRPRQDYNPDTIQLQPENSAGDSQMLSDFRSLDSLTSSDMAFLKSI
ncbi:AC2 protein [Siegesbeckia yellow vein Guangxi virus]|uniref:Transcriptional activator protein n=1 Tax=Siegesbeckia yellow vein Guangxi virus TaxID=379728 RepID=Q0KFV8_9GEMI|nr:AC2 protein [Siegesbeckia yellow vein Guangxi virus]CAJ87649.1 AC2 protein [Siegesbeckia yellow vein Guangxi virus]